MIDDELENNGLDVEILEFSLDNEEIDELIENLQKLKQIKTNFSFEIGDELELFIHHEDDKEFGYDKIDDEDEEEDNEEDDGSGGIIVEEYDEEESEDELDDDDDEEEDEEEEDNEEE